MIKEGAMVVISMSKNSKESAANRLKIFDGFRIELIPVDIGTIGKQIWLIEKRVESIQRMDHIIESRTLGWLGRVSGT